APIAPDIVCVDEIVGRPTEISTQTMGSAAGFPFRRSRHPPGGVQMTAELHQLAAEQDGLLALEQLRRHGVSAWQQGQFTSDGRLHRIAPRVYAVGGAPNSHRQRLRAGLLCLGERSWVSFEAAA